MRSHNRVVNVPVAHVASDRSGKGIIRRAIRHHSDRTTLGLKAVKQTVNLAPVMRLRDPNIGPDHRDGDCGTIFYADILQRGNRVAMSDIGVFICWSSEHVDDLLRKIDQIARLVGLVEVWERNCSHRTRVVRGHRRSRVAIGSQHAHDIG